MVKIRLQRGGAKKRPFYRVIAIDERRKRDGRALEFLGTYNPIAEPAEIRLDLEAIAAWQSKGARLSDAVRALVRRGNSPEPEPVRRPVPAPAAPAETPETPAEPAAAS